MSELDAQRDEYLKRWVPSDDRGDDWYGLLSYARESCPVAHSSGAGGFSMLSRHEDAERVVLDYRRFSSAEGITIPHNPAAPKMPPIDLDPPLQRHFRRLIGPAVAPAALREHEGRITAFADQLLDRFCDDGSCEFMAAFARPFPALVLADVILGVDDQELLLEIQRRVEPIGSHVESADAAAAWVYLRECVTELLTERRRRSADDSMLSTLVHGEVDDRKLTEDEQIGTAMILVLGGLATTTDAFGSIIYRATQDPDVEAILRTDGWHEHALDEFLRLDSPVQYVGRTVTERCTIRDVTFEPGEVVMAHLGSGNRDAAVFEDPDQLRLDREATRNRTLHFGVGVHRCVGMHLARAELRIGFDRLLARAKNFRLADGADVEFLTGMSCGPRSLPIVFDAVQ